MKRLYCPHCLILLGNPHAPDCPHSDPKHAEREAKESDRRIKAGVADEHYHR